jgi:chaperonin GroEL
MNIIVCIKRVPASDSRVQIGPDGRSLNPQGVETVLNTYDEFAIEAALQLKEKLGTKAVASAEIEFVDGMSFDRGYLSPYFISNQAEGICELDDPLLLLVDGKVSVVKDLVPALETVLEANKPLLIIAEEVEGEALALLVVNRLQGVFVSCAVKAPGFGDRRKAMLQDMAVLTNSRVISDDIGVKFESVELDFLGRADKVKATKEETTIIGGKGKKADIDGRIAQVKKEIQDTTSDYDREKLQERLAKLAGGVAEIKVGAATETEMKEKKHRFEDALNATKAAVEEGVVPGGGTALLNALKALKSLNSEGDEGIGIAIVRRALEEPTRQLAHNAGAEGSLVVERIKKEKPGIGYDVAAGEYADMVKAGITDPTKVVRLALQNAASVAGLLLTTEAVVVEKREKKKAAPPPGAGGMPDEDF